MNTTALVSMLAAAALGASGCGSSHKCGPEALAPASPASSAAPSASAASAAASAAPSASAAPASSAAPALSAAPSASAASAASTPSTTGAPVARSGSGVATSPGSSYVAPDAILRVEVARDGKLSIEGVRLDDPRELTLRARVSSRSRPDLEVVIAADKDAPFSHVMNAMDLVKQASVTKISFALHASAPPAPVAPPPGSVPTLLPGDRWQCRFAGPIERLENASAFIAIHVGPDGKPQTVDVLEASGPGLADAARLCALKHEFSPAKDASGKPTAGVMKLRVSFERGRD